MDNGDEVYGDTPTLTLTLPLTLTPTLTLPFTPNQVYGEGDELTIAFDRATDEAFESTHARSGDESFVNGLFEFSHVLGNRLRANSRPNPSPSPNPNGVPHLTLT